MVLVEARMRGWGRACKVVELLDRDDVEATTHEIINAVSGAHSLNRVESQLKQECCICFDNFPPSQVSYFPPSQVSARATSRPDRSV